MTTDASEQNNTGHLTLCVDGPVINVLNNTHKDRSFNVFLVLTHQGSHE